MPTIFPVKQSELLRQPEYLISKPELVETIHRVVDNLVNIEDKTGEFLLYLDDGRVIDTKGWDGWEWTHGIGLYGIYQYYQQTGDRKMKQIIDDWFTKQLAKTAPTKNINTVCPFLTLAYLYEQQPNPTWLPLLERWAEWVMYDMPKTRYGGLQHIVYNSENYQQLWDDTLMMSVLPLAKIGKILQRPEFIEEAKYQFLFHIQQLMDKKSGLWFHGWTFDGNHNFAEALWARGDCWVTIAIPEILAILNLPVDDAFRRFLTQVLQRQIETLAEYQDESGLFHTLLDDPNSYLESSATAGFAYGILKAVRKRYIDKRYFKVGEQAIRGVLNNINAEGELINTSFGTAMGSDLDFYRNIPLTSMPYGQAMAALCLTEYLRVYI